MLLVIVDGFKKTEEQRKEKIKRKQRKEADKRLEYLIGEAKFAVS